MNVLSLLLGALNDGQGFHNLVIQQLSYIKFDYFGCALCQMIVRDTFPQDHGRCPRCSQESALAAISWQ